MMEKARKKRWGMRIGVGVMAVLAILVGICVMQLFHYGSRAPKLTVKERLEFPCGTQIPWKELASVECKGSYSLRLMILDTNIPTAKVLEEKDQKLFTGEEAGYVRISIIASGEVAELVSEEAIVYVKPDAKEEEAILKESKEKFEEIHTWLSEHDFSGEKEFADDELVTLYHLDPERRIGYAEYVLSRKDKGGNEKYYKIFADYELISKDEAPKLKNVTAREVDKNAFLTAKNQTEKVVLIKGQR